jgi:hypothetical protein
LNGQTISDFESGGLLSGGFLPIFQKEGFLPGGFLPGGFLPEEFLPTL